MATSPFYVSQYTPQHMTEEEQIQEAIRLSLGDSGSSEREPDVFLPCDMSSFADYSAVRSCIEVPTIVQKLAYRTPTQDDLPDPDVIQSAINRAKKSSLGPSVSDLESVSRMLFSDFGVDLEEEINCDGDEAKDEEVEEVVELENDADDVNGNRKEGCRLQFGRSNVHYTKAHAREIDISKIVSGPPERELYGYPLGQYYQPLNKTLRNVEHKRKMTREDKKFCQLMLLRIPLSENSLSVETPQRPFVSPPPVSAVSLQGRKSSAGPRLGTKRDCSSDAETQVGPKRLCVSTSEADSSSVKRKYSSLTGGVQVDQNLVASDLAESFDNEPIEVNGGILQQSPKKMRLIEKNVGSTAVGCNSRILEEPQSIDLLKDANDYEVVESKNQHSHFSKKNLNIFIAVLENKQMQSRKRMESAEINRDGSSHSGEFPINNNIKHISINSPSSHCKEAIKGDEISVYEAEESPLARKIACNEHFFEDLIVSASQLPVGQEKAFQNVGNVVTGASAKTSSSRPSLSAARAALETLILKKLSVGTQKASANRRGKIPERLGRPPCKSTEWNKQLQSVKFRTQPRVLSAGFPAMIMYSPYHMKLFNEMDLKEKVNSSVACINDEYKGSEPAVPLEQLKAPAVCRTGLLTGSPNGLSYKETVAKSSIAKKPIEGTVMDDMKAGPSGYNLRELNDDSAPPDDKLAVFNTNDFLKSYFDTVLKWWVVNVSKRLIFPNYLSNRATCPILPGNFIFQISVEYTTVWRFFASNLDQITNSIQKTKKFLDTKNQLLEPTTQSLLLKDDDYLKTSQFIKDMLKYMHEQYGLSKAIEYESHEVTSMIQRRRGAPSSFSELETKSCIGGDYEDVLLSSSSSTSPNCSEEIHLVKVHHHFTGGERGHSTMHMAIFTQGDLIRPPLDKKSPRCSKEDSNQKGVLTTSEINFGLEILSITPKRPGSPDSALESQGSNDDDCVGTLISDKSNRGSSENVSHVDNKKSSPLLNKVQFEDRVFLSTEFRQSALCSNDGEMDTTKDEPLKEKILDGNTRGIETYTNPSNGSHCTPLKYSQFLSEAPYHYFSDPNITAVSESVSEREKSGIKYEQSSNPVGNVVVAPLSMEITKELHSDCGYTSDTNMENKSIHRDKSNSLSSKDLSSGSESSSDEKLTTSHFSEVATRRNSLGYPSQYSDRSFDEINADDEEFFSGWSSYVGKSSLFKNITEADVFSGPYKLLKYFEISCFGQPIVMQSVTPDVFLTVKDQEKRYTISRHNPFVKNDNTQPDALSLTEMVRMAAKLGCFHGIGLAFQRLNGHGFMKQFRHTMRTGLFREADFIKAATVGLTNFIETHYDDVSKRQFLDYLGRQFGKRIPTQMNYLLAPHNDIDMKFWTLTVGDVTPRNIVVQKTKENCDPTVLRWNKSRIGNCFLDLVSLLVTLPDPRCKEVQVLSTLLSYLSALGETLLIFNIQYPLHYHAIIMSIRKAAMLLVYQFMAEEDTYRGPAEQNKLYAMVWNAALFATDPDEVNWDCPWKEKDPCPLAP